jgi:hypothetical protein
MDYPFDFNLENVAMVIEVRGSIASNIHKLNNFVECKLHDPSRDVACPQNSRESTPMRTTMTDESVIYIKLPIDPYPEGGYSFGRSTRCTVVLPGEDTPFLSNGHFRIHVCNDRTWMFRNESPNLTAINGIPVVGSVALHPQEPDFIRIQNIILRVHITSGWITPRECKPGAPLKLRTTSSRSATFQIIPIPVFRLGAGSEYHILKQTPISAEGQHYAAVHVITGRRCVAMICHKVSEKGKWRRRYDLISDICSRVGINLYSGSVPI